MKNQYFGDINDYRKYGLLRTLSSVGDLRLAVAWMLTPDDGGPDGGRIAYLSQKQEWEPFDPPLFQGLKRLLTSGACRSVAQIEGTDLLTNTRYFSGIVPDQREGRTSWFDDLLQFAIGSDLLFLDPDNGLEVRSKPLGTRGSSKYLHWHEVESLWRTGLSLLIYQHYPRRPREEFVAEITTELARRTGAPLIEALSTSHVVFLLCGQEAHRERLVRAVESLDREWPDQLRVLPPADSPPSRASGDRPSRTRTGSEETLFRVYIALSLDGYIADKDGGVSWLDPYFSPELDFDGFMQTIGTTVMGRKTYDQAEARGSWPYGDHRRVVLTHRPITQPPAGVETFQGDVRELADSLRRDLEGTGKDVWLMGGGNSIRAFHDAGLVDRWELFFIPTLLGEEISLFPPLPGPASRWGPRYSKTYENGIVEVCYEPFAN